MNKLKNFLLSNTGFWTAIVVFLVLMFTTPWSTTPPTAASLFSNFIQLVILGYTVFLTFIYEKPKA